MASTEERIRQLVADNLEVDGQAIALEENLNVSPPRFSACPLSTSFSFGRVVAREFNVSFTPERLCEREHRPGPYRARRFPVRLKTRCGRRSLIADTAFFQGHPVP